MVEELSRFTLDDRGDGVQIITFKDKDLFSDADIAEIGQLLNAILGAREPRLILDLHMIKSAGSMFFGMLMQLRRQINELEGKLFLAAPSDFLKTSLRVSGLEKTMNVLPTVEKALKRAGK